MQIKKVVGHSDIRTTSYHYGANYDEIEKPLSEQLWEFLKTTQNWYLN